MKENLPNREPIIVGDFAAYTPRFPGKLPAFDERSPLQSRGGFACPFLSAAERVLPAYAREPAKIEVGGVNLGLVLDRQRSDVGVGCERTAHADRPQAGQE